jgi:hypothetical protein
VEGELALVHDLDRRERLRQLLLPPHPRNVGWDYGVAGERHEVWIVGQSADAQIALCYAEQGFGPSSPWGFIFPADDSLGMDSQWHSRLEDAAICAGLIQAPPGYRVPGPR